MDLWKRKRHTAMERSWQHSPSAVLAREAGQMAELATSLTQAHLSNTLLKSPRRKWNLFLWSWTISTSSLEVTETESNCLKAICRCPRQLPFYVRLSISLSKRAAESQLRCHLGWNPEILRAVVGDIVHFFEHGTNLPKLSKFAKSNKTGKKITAAPNIDPLVLFLI